MGGREEEEAQIFIEISRGGWLGEPPLKMAFSGAAQLLQYLRPI